MVDKRHLAEVVTGTERTCGSSVHAHRGLAVHDDTESDAGLILLGEHRTCGKCPLMRVICESGQALFVHGNVSSALFWQPTMLALPEPYRPLAIDLRGFGDTDPEPVDATRGLGDCAAAGSHAVQATGSRFTPRWKLDRR
jgi:pimeloyl-ACP methyl ester carboxylesterase